MPTQAHSKAIWRESSNSGLVPAAEPMFVVPDGDDITYSPTGPEAYAFYDVGDGDFTLLPVTSAYPRRLYAALVGGNIEIY